MSDKLKEFDTAALIPSPSHSSLKSGLLRALFPITCDITAQLVRVHFWFYIPSDTISHGGQS